MLASNAPHCGAFAFSGQLRPQSLVGGDLVLRQQDPQLCRRRAAHGFAVDAGQQRLPEDIGGQHGYVEAEVLGAEQPHREVSFAVAIQSQVAASRQCRHAMFLEPARDRVRIVVVDVQGDRGIGIGGAVQDRADQPRLEVAEELQRALRGLAAAAQRARLVVGGEQSLVLAQRILDLAVAGQRRIVMDAEPLGGLELGLVVVADTALGHQPGSFVGETLAAFAGPGLRMHMRVGTALLAAVRHRAPPRDDLSGTVTERASPRHRRAQKMSNASSAGWASWSCMVSYSVCMRSWSSTLSHSVAPLDLTWTIPSGGSRLRSGWSFSATFM